MSEYQQERKGFWHHEHGTGTSETIALETWARAARPILEEVAHRYHGVVGEAELAERLQTETGIRTTRPHGRWLPKLLGPLATLHHREGYPPLTALVVDGSGRVGEHYDDVLRAAEQRPISDRTARQEHAARARLECYRWAGSVPEDGGVPAPVTRAVGGEGRRRSSSGERGLAKAERPGATGGPRAAAERPVAVCPTCFLALPTTGVCDECG